MGNSKYAPAMPEKVVDCKDLVLTVNGAVQHDAAGRPVMDEAAWLKVRRGGIGGSDSATVLGISPWRSKAELMDDKCGVSPLIKKEYNATAKMAGHMFEAAIREEVLPYLLRQAGAKDVRVEADTNMYRHGNPDYAFARADIDGLVAVDGEICIAEIKATSFRNKHAIDDYWREGKCPPYYECQVRHYMAVMNVDRAYICCAWGLNPEGEAALIRIDRNMALEEQLMDAEKDFWERHVVNGEPIAADEETCAPGVILDYYGRRTATEDNKKPVDLSSLAPVIVARQALLDRAAELKDEAASLEKEAEDADAKIVLALGGKEYGAYEEGGQTVKVFARQKKSAATYDASAVRAKYPGIWDKAGTEKLSASKLSAAEKGKIAEFKKDGEPTGKWAITVKAYDNAPGKKGGKA